MITLKGILFSAVLLVFNVTSAQNFAAIETTVSCQFSSEDAIKLHLEVVEKGFKSLDLYKKIADFYYFNADYEKAAHWFDQLFSTYPNQIDALYTQRYAESLKRLEKYVKADEVLAAHDQRAPGYSSNEAVQEESGTIRAATKKIEYTLQRFRFLNSKHAEFAPTLHNDKLIFAKAKIKKNKSKKNKQNNTAPADLYQSNIGGYLTPLVFEKKLNSKDQESTAAVTNDGETIYFTRTSSGKSKIYIALKKNGKWNKPKELAFNSKHYTCAHPSLNKDNTRLYFASDMPGTAGLSDIWYVDIKDNGSYGSPVNMGTSINTAGRESYPFISQSGDLYFASDTHSGLGGLDLFVTKEVDKNNLESEIINLGAPINSAFDDFSLVLRDNEETGFFVSNRDTGMGSDDIYKFSTMLACTAEIEGFIFKKREKETLADVTIALLDMNNNVLESVSSDASGKYIFTGKPCNANYRIRASKKAYQNNDLFFDTYDDTRNVTRNLYLENDLRVLKEGDDLAHVLGLNPISFGLNRFNIKEAAALELEIVIAFLQANPDAKVDIRSHTDSRSPDSYNQVLSDKRNSATIVYMIDNGIHKGRISGKGYGESQPLNGCSNGVECSEGEHQRNRRSEFILEKISGTTLSGERY